MKVYNREFVEPKDFNEEDRIYSKTIIHCSKCNKFVTFFEAIELDIYDQYFKKIIKENKALRDEIKKLKEELNAK